jgi:hypothetical protein
MRSHICLAGLGSKFAAGNYFWLAFKTQSEGSNVSKIFHIQNSWIGGERELKRGEGRGKVRTGDKELTFCDFYSWGSVSSRAF